MTHAPFTGDELSALRELGGAELERCRELFRDPRYGTALTSSEYRELAGHVLDGMMPRLVSEVERLQNSKAALVREVKRLQDLVAVQRPGWRP